MPAAQCGALGKRSRQTGMACGQRSQHVPPPLATVRVDAAAMGSVALRTLLERANNPEAPCVTTLIGVELVKRASVAPPRPL